MDNSSTIKKNYKLMGTEQDPTVIAQRLLNLYRQLHIFSPEKKAAYNQMLLEQPQEIKRVLGTLPGGVVVQQYIADIEAEEGMNVETFDTPQESTSEQTSFLQSQMFSSANQAQGQPAVVSVASDPEMIRSIVNTFKDALATSERNHQQNTKELVQSILAVSEQNRKEDTKELAQTIVALQNKLTQTILEKKATRVKSGESDEQNLDISDEPNVLNMDQLEKVIRNLSEAQSAVIREMASSQSELIREMSVTQTQELSREMGRVLKEIQQMSNQTLIDTVQTVHRENMDFFKNQMTSSVRMSSIAEGSGLPRQEFQMPTEEETEQMENTGEKTEVRPLKEKLFSVKSKRKNKKKTSKETILPAFDETETEDDSQYHWEEVADYLTDTTAEHTNGAEDYEWEYIEDESEEYPEEAENAQETTDDIISQEEISADLLPYETQAEDSEKEYFEEENNTENVAEKTEEENQTVEITEESQGQTSSDTDDGEYEWEYVEDNEEISDIDAQENISTNMNLSAETNSEMENEEYEWEYVEDDGTEAEEPVEENFSNDEEYEWEYVEDDGTENAEDHTIDELPNEEETQDDILIKTSEESVTTEASSTEETGAPAEEEIPQENKISSPLQGDDMIDLSAYNDVTDILPESEITATTMTMPIKADFTPYDLTSEGVSLDQADNPLLSPDKKLIFNTEEKSEESIILSDDFGISSEDGTGIQPS